MAEEAVFLLAQADPLRAAAILARALKIQPRGGQQAFVRVLAQTLADNSGDRRLAAVARDLK